MLDLVAVEVTAQARNQLVFKVNELLEANGEDVTFLPRVNVRGISPQELKFSPPPHICIVGPGLAAQDITELRELRKILAKTAIIVSLDHNLDKLHIVEQLARMGVDDTITNRTLPSEFLRKIVILSRRLPQTKHGELVLVDSGKGGCGVTSVAAGLAETLINSGKKVVLIDFDLETQDLSRFLQVRPVINENLQMIFQQLRPITKESVEDCLIPVWADDPSLLCLPPFPEVDRAYESGSSYSRTLVSVLEVLDDLFDIVVVDLGGIRGAIQKTLFRVADKSIIVLNNDPASLYSTVDKITSIRSYIASKAEIYLVENAPLSGGLSAGTLKREFTRAAKLEEEEWSGIRIPFCRYGRRWPGSGRTIISAGRSSIKKEFAALTAKVGLTASSSAPEKEAEVSQFKKRSPIFAISNFLRGSKLSYAAPSTKPKPLLEYNPIGGRRNEAQQGDTQMFSGIDADQLVTNPTFEDI